MTDEARNYNIAAIRRLLLAAFTTKELRAFCQDRPIFYPILGEFSDSDGLSKMVGDVITYCEKRLHFDELLAEVQNVNPNQYARFEADLWVSDPRIPSHRKPETRRGGTKLIMLRLGLVSLLVVLVAIIIGSFLLANNDKWPLFPDRPTPGPEAITDTPRAMTMQEEMLATIQAQGTATESARVLPTAHAFRFIALSWPEVLYDSFSADTGDWEVGEYSSQRISGNRLIIKDRYYWEGESLQPVTWNAVRQKPDLGPSFYLACDFQNVGGLRETNYGLLFRYINGNYYAFSIEDDQEAYVDLFNEGSWMHLDGWTNLSFVQPWKVNRLAVIAQGTGYLFFVNGNYVGEITDDTLQGGKAGLQISLEGTNVKGTFEIDDFELRSP